MFIQWTWVSQFLLVFLPSSVLEKEISGIGQFAGWMPNQQCQTTKRNIKHWTHPVFINHWIPDGRKAHYASSPISHTQYLHPYTTFPYHINADINKN